MGRVARERRRLGPEPVKLLREQVLKVTDPDVTDYIVWVHFTFCLTNN